jgi:hypothetical protein
VAGAVIEVARPDGKAKWRMQAEKSMACELEPRAAPRTISYLHIGGGSKVKSGGHSMIS